MALGPRELALADVSDDVVNGEWKCTEEVTFTIIVAPSVPIHLKEAKAALFVARHLVRSGNGWAGSATLGSW